MRLMAAPTIRFGDSGEVEIDGGWQIDNQALKEKSSQ